MTDLTAVEIKAFVPARDFELAKQFLHYCKTKNCRFIPIGVAQGWSPMSYAYAVQTLQQLGYRYIAFGGFVPLRTSDILACLRESSAVRSSDTQFHLLGITRCLDRQSHVVDFCFAGLVMLRIRAVLRGWFAGDAVEQFGRQGRFALLDRGVESR